MERDRAFWWLWRWVDSSASTIVLGVGRGKILHSLPPLLGSFIFVCVSWKVYGVDWAIQWTIPETID